MHYKGKTEPLVLPKRNKCQITSTRDKKFRRNTVCVYKNNGRIMRILDKHGITFTAPIYHELNSHYTCLLCQKLNNSLVHMAAEGQRRSGRAENFFVSCYYPPAPPLWIMDYGLHEEYISTSLAGVEILDIKSSELVKK